MKPQCYLYKGEYVPLTKALAELNVSLSGFRRFCERHNVDTEAGLEKYLKKVQARKEREVKSVKKSKFNRESLLAVMQQHTFTSRTAMARHLKCSVSHLKTLFLSFDIEDPWALKTYTVGDQTGLRPQQAAGLLGITMSYVYQQYKINRISLQEQFDLLYQKQQEKVDGHQSPSTVSA